MGKGGEKMIFTTKEVIEQLGRAGSRKKTEKEIEYYLSIGLLRWPSPPTEPRGRGSRRYYTIHHIRDLSIILALKELGFTTEKIKEILKGGIYENKSK
jgi:DNA-binding transcriptional MerR regulator